MNSSSDAAESVIRMSLQGVEVATKISGVGAKNIAKMLLSILKDKRMIIGKTNLINMMKTGKELKVFGIKESELKQFSEQSKNYGVVFCALIKKGQKSKDGMVDIMVKAEDSSKINRIIEKFNIRTCDKATVRNKMEEGRFDNTKGVEVKSIEDKMADDIITKPIQKEDKELVNPNVAKTEKSPLSEPLSMNKNNSEQGSKFIDVKPSVREEIKKIKSEMKEPKDLDKTEFKKKNIPNKQNKKIKKNKDRGL